jgi:hypothetical protein
LRRGFVAVVLLLPFDRTVERRAATWTALAQREAPQAAACRILPLKSLADIKYIPDPRSADVPLAVCVLFCALLHPGVFFGGRPTLLTTLRSRCAMPSVTKADIERAERQAAAAKEERLRIARQLEEARKL